VTSLFDNPPTIQRINLPNEVKDFLDSRIFFEFVQETNVGRPPTWADKLTYTPPLSLLIKFIEM